MGVQHPMILVLRKSDMYNVTLLSFSSEKLGAEIDGWSVPVDNDPEEATGNHAHVQSIKIVRAHNIPIPNTTAHA